ncbi:indole-3-acetate beta-glucosyltransferase isoform X1 [Iris pallida]|uniref:Glycosyltransferase n=1 Tax=Iris pallida TaxID=29817 RepID=A0AAX6HMQ0_IRIPA|nr:indole-3-acetate beta-glucosyltransferase isoform X1 [Iris pallida]
MMNLCRLLAGRGLLVSFVVTEEWLQLLGSGSGSSAAASSWPPNLRIRTIPNVVPSERTRGTDFRKFIQAIYTKMEGPTEELIEGLQPPADSILTTSLLAWAAAIADRRNIPVCSLCTESPAVFLAFHHFENPDVQLKPSGKERDDALAYLPRTDTFLFGDAQSSTSSETIIRSYKKALSWFAKSNALLFTSFYELDRHVIDALSSHLLPLPVYPLGPSIPHMTLADEPLDDDTKISLGWLDSQPECSVVYIALGSFAPVSADQMEALADGLKLSGVRFFWVVREGAEPMQELAGTGGMGLAVPWCDQLRVLSHPSVGGFLTHCGWNSVLEGVFAGVPMLAFPLVWDQFPNSRSVVDDWKVGFRLKEEAGRQGGEVVVPKEDVAKMVKKLMDMECSERKRAKDLQGKCKEALGEGGSLWRNLDSFVQGLVSSKKSTGN